MATKKGYKKLTNAEKKFNKEFRRQMREQGILPPVKPKLNRKKFSKDVQEEWIESGDIFYLTRALHCLIPSDRVPTQITSEQVGMLKVMKLAIEYKKFEEELESRGEKSYSFGEFYKKVVKPIVEL